MRFLLTFICVLLASSTTAKTLRIAVISDLNGSYGSVEYSARVGGAIARIIELKPDLVLSTGDMVAGQKVNPKLTQDRLDQMWAAFHTVVTEPLEAAGIPFAVTPGNHDGSAYPGFGKERDTYAREWQRLKSNLDITDMGNFPFYYSLTVGNTRFVSLDATTIGHLSGNQMEWLDQQLHEANDQGQNAVTFSHLPQYPVANNRTRDYIGDPALAALYRDTETLLHLSGHHHAYYPGWKDDVYYVAQSCLGGGARSLIGTRTTSPHSFTMVEISDDGALDIYALLAPDYTQKVNIESLPRSISIPDGTLTRSDLVPHD